MVLNDTEILGVLSRRYGASADALVAVLCPLLIPIRSLDKEVIKLTGQSHYRASFTVAINDENRSVLQRGRTGKFVPSGYGGGEPGWREVAKGRIIEVYQDLEFAEGEIYVGGRKADLEHSLHELTEIDFLEIDQYGASAKVLSGMSEYYLVKDLQERGCNVIRMPEDMARHLGHYANYDFQVEKNGVVKRIEVKSLWGTDTKFARLIHSANTRPRGPENLWTVEQRANYYPTSSCKFETQDIFAVSLFLRTGIIGDFAFARSVPNDQHAHGLPRSTKYPDHVNQNPICELGDGVWYSTIDAVWDLD